MSLPQDKRQAPVDAKTLAGWIGWIEDLGARLDMDDTEATVDGAVALLGGLGQTNSPPWTVLSAMAPLAPPEWSVLSCRHALLEADWYGEHDDEDWARVRPLTWLWRQFDASPWAVNEAFAIPFRAMLARRIFAECGEAPRIFGGVTWSFGYRIRLGDRVVIHRNALLDDRGGLEIGDDCSISDSVEIYSHRHSVTDIGDVAREPTRLLARTRVTVGARILSGVEIGPDALVGAGALVTKSVPAGQIVGGVPARVLGHKPSPPEPQG